jgi:hypothetical protein
VTGRSDHVKAQDDSARAQEDTERAQADHDRDNRIGRLNEFRTSTVGVALFYGYLVAILLSGLLVGKTVLDNRRISKESHSVLCSLKQERERRVSQTQAILAHPNEPENARVIRALGKPLLVRSLESAKSDAEAFKKASC